MEDALFVTSYGADRALQKYTRKNPTVKDYRIVRAMKRGETLGWKLRVITDTHTHTLTEQDVEDLPVEA